jgi:hypothetical protein
VSDGPSCMPWHKPHCPAHHSLTACSGLQLPEDALVGMFLLCRYTDTFPHHHSGLWGAVRSDNVSGSDKVSRDEN